MALAVSAYEGHDDGSSCPNQNIVRAEKNSDVTVCMEVTNTGDQTLRDIVVTDTVLGITADTQLIEVFEPLGELAPGQSAILAWEVSPERNLRPRTRISAVPTDGVSPEAAGPSVSTTQNYDIQVFEPDSDPGFADGFNAALIFFPVLWLARRWWLQRAENQRVERERVGVEAQATQDVAPPAPVAAPAGSPESNDDA